MIYFSSKLELAKVSYRVRIMLTFSSKLKIHVASVSAGRAKPSRAVSWHSLINAHLV